MLARPKISDTAEQERVWWLSLAGGA